jgi:hypothetical protein
MNARASRGALLMIDDVIPRVKAIYSVLDKRMGHE